MVASSHLLSEISRRSETLWERLARVAASGRELPPPETLEQRLKPWARACARGNHRALLRRLDWEGVDPQLAALALAESTADEPQAPWIEELAEYLERARAAARTLAEPEAPGITTPLPFEELWAPWLELARERMGQDAGSALEQLTPSARADLEIQLLEELTTLSEAAAYELFDERRRAASSARAGGYRHFIAECLNDPLTQLYGRFPVLARQTCRAVRQWRQRALELLRHLESDRADIARVFAGGADAGPLTAITGGVSDRHRDGRQVLLLELQSGLRLVYKPRSVGLEAGLARFFDWCRDRGLGTVPRAARVLAREDHGWMELVAAEPLLSMEAAADYYRRAGVLLAIAYALRAEDLHAENLVATAAGPVIVDAEMLLQPVRARLVTGEEPELQSEPMGSCLATGLLTQLLPGGEEDRALGGLRAQGPRRRPCRRFDRINRDDMAVEIGEELLPAHASALVVGGEPALPEQFAGEIALGFEHGYRFLLAERSALLASSADGAESSMGPLADFRGAQVRVLFRASQEYGRVLQLEALPRNQRSGLMPSWLREALLQGLAELDERPALWPAILDERRALEAGDVPWFHVAADGTQIDTSSGPIDGQFALPGLDAVRQRIASLAPEDLRRQLDLIRRALAPEPARALAPALRKAAAAPGELASDGYLELARQLGEELLPALERPDELAGRWDLAHGRVGSALFLVALARSTGDARFERACMQQLEPLLEALLERLRGGASGPPRELLELPLGGLSGIGSLVFGLVWLSRLLDRPELLGCAARSAVAIDEQRIALDRAFDLDRGTAGATLGLLALAEATGDPGHLEAACRCGEHLLAHQQVAGALCGGWRNPSGLGQTGFAHGAAGIARALSALGRASSDVRFTLAAQYALGYERSLYDPERRNWPALLTDAAGSKQRRNFTVAFCRGAPGIALSRLLLPPSLRDPAALAEQDAALGTTAASPPAPLDHLCCGNFGRSSVLLTAAQRLGDAAGFEAAQRIARTTLERAALYGRFKTSLDCYENRDARIGLLKGTVGIGYQLLRLAGVSKLPDVLALELPSEQSSRAAQSAS